MMFHEISEPHSGPSTDHSSLSIVPGCAYLLSCWYPRFELQKRNAVFYLLGSMSSAFSGILAYGFSHMQGLGDLGPTFGQHYGPKYDPAAAAEEPDAPSGILTGISGWRWM